MYTSYPQCGMTHPEAHEKSERLQSGGQPREKTQTQIVNVPIDIEGCHTEEVNWC